VATWSFVFFGGNVGSSWSAASDSSRLLQQVRKERKPDRLFFSLLASVCGRGGTGSLELSRSRAARIDRLLLLLLFRLLLKIFLFEPLLGPRSLMAGILGKVGD
jgi:hypothetical protein